VSLAIIVKKEVRELATPQTLAPVVAVSILFGFIGGFVGNIEEEVEARPVVALVDQDGSLLSAVFVSMVDLRADLVYNGSSEADALAAVEGTEAVAVIVLPEGFQAAILNNTTGTVRVTWYMKGAGVLDTISTAVVEDVLAQADAAVSAVLVSTAPELDPVTVLFPTARNDTTRFKDKVLEGVAPETVASMATSQSIMVPMIIMILFIMAGQTIIASMALEKENKTLETLLTMPVKRTSIVAGKIVGAAVVGFIMAGIYMVGFAFYIANVTMGVPEEVEIDLGLSAADYALVAVSLFTALLAGLALAMLMGTFAKDFKSGQTLIFPLVLMALLPMFVTMFKDFDTLSPGMQALIFLIPFSHPMMAMRSLMFGDYLMVGAGIAYSIVFAVVVIMILVRIFSTDKLLTGRISRKGGGKGLIGLLRR
jgi:ABC-2 type transport system permease protein